MSSTINGQTIWIILIIYVGICNCQNLTLDIYEYGENVHLKSKADLMNDTTSRYIYFQIFKLTDTKFLYFCLIDITTDCRHKSLKPCRCELKPNNTVEIDLFINTIDNIGSRVRGTIVIKPDDRQIRSNVVSIEDKKCGCY